MSDGSKPTLYLLCGLPGSGKTTEARRLEDEGAGVRLNADEWTSRLYPEDAEAAARDGRKTVVEALQWEVAEQLLANGVSVIVDWGVWARAERDDYRQRAAAVGASTRIVYLDVPLDELHQRVAHRNLDLPPGTFYIAPDELDEWATAFEPPLADELGTG